jgi:3-phenylpropionate/trans-cinnamate dioxygenase ferredoxin subunit
VACIEQRRVTDVTVAVGDRSTALELSRRAYTMASEFIATIKTSDIPVGGVTATDLRGMRIAVANVGGKYYAFDDACTHEQCSLAEEGELDGTTLTCTCHGSEFDVQTGKVLAPPATVPLRAYAARVDGDALLIEV